MPVLFADEAHYNPVMRTAQRLGLAAVLVLSSGDAIAAQPAAPPTASIAGTLTSADLGNPVRRAMVKLVSVQPARVRTATTDANGRFRFVALPAGDYTLSAAKAGFLESIFGARRPGAGVPGTVIQLADGQQLDSLAMKLPRGGVISGIVTDEFGDPALGVPVRAMRLGYANGERRAEPIANATTDDLGAYRLPGLLPGDYIVSAVPRDSVAAQAAMDESLRARQAEIEASGRAAPQLRVEASPSPGPGYVPVYFGGAVSPAAAVRVTVRVGQQVGAVDIQLQAIETATIAGRVVTPDGSPASARLQLVDPSMPVANLAVWFRNATASGAFSFTGLAPGTYVLNAQSQSRELGGLITASVTVPVDAGRVSVVVTLRSGITVSGRIDTGTVGPPVNVERLRVTLEPLAMAGDWETSRYEDAPEPDGTFTIRGVPPGRYRVDVAGLPASWALESATFGDRDGADVHLVLERGENVGTGLLKLAARAGEISGLVTTAGGDPAPDRTIVLFPADPAHRVPHSRRIRVVQPSPDGRYTIRNLPAGQYRVAAVDGVEAGEQFAREFLDRIDAGAVAGTVSAGVRTTIDVRIR